ELRAQAALCTKRGVPFSARARDCLNASAECLEGLGEVPGFWQHGDFCLNNLLVSPSALAIIDFDEFGYTLMPLHDQIGLALSLHDLAPRGVLPLPLDGEITSSPGAGPVERSHLPGLFLHHLLWR